jgi:hypothetical protein
MTKKIIFINSIALFLLLLVSSCGKETVATVGNLHVYVINAQGEPMVGSEVLLANTWNNETQGLTVTTGWTDAQGKVSFLDLAPNYYWYGVRGWKDYGAIQVYSGLDQYVYLQVNSPAK